MSLEFTEEVTVSVSEEEAFGQLSPGECVQYYGAELLLADMEPDEVIDWVTSNFPARVKLIED
jgi:FKBP-type peptidyl-prolyl cis-trans isomerase 2